MDRAVFTESLNADKLPSHDDTLTVILIDERRDDFLHFWDDLIGGITDDDEESLANDDDKEFNPDDVVALPYLMGTMGLPKGVMLTHWRLSTRVAQQVDGDNPNIGFTADDVILCAMPMFQMYSLNTIMMCSLCAAAAIIVMRRFDLAEIMELVEKHRIMIAPLVPLIVVAVAKSDKAAVVHDLSSVRMVLSDAAPMGKDIEDTFMAKLPGQSVRVPALAMVFLAAVVALVFFATVVAVFVVATLGGVDERAGSLAHVEEGCGRGCGGDGSARGGAAARRGVGAEQDKETHQTI